MKKINKPTGFLKEFTKNWWFSVSSLIFLRTSVLCQNGFFDFVQPLSTGSFIKKGDHPTLHYTVKNSATIFSILGGMLLQLNWSCTIRGPLKKNSCRNRYFIFWNTHYQLLKESLAWYLPGITFFYKNCVIFYAWYHPYSRGVSEVNTLLLYLGLLLVELSTPWVLPNT